MRTNYCQDDSIYRSCLHLKTQLISDAIQRTTFIKLKDLLSSTSVCTFNVWASFQITCRFHFKPLEQNYVFGQKESHMSKLSLKFYFIRDKFKQLYHHNILFLSPYQIGCSVAHSPLVKDVPPAWAEVQAAIAVILMSRLTYDSSKSAQLRTLEIQCLQTHRFLLHVFTTKCVSLNGATPS